MRKKIPRWTWVQLNRGFKTKIDLRDKKLFLQNNWRAVFGSSGNYRVVRNHKIPGGGKTIINWSRSLMEEILGRELTPEEVVHHKNGDTLDNRRDNLQVCDRDHNNRDVRMSSRNTSGRTGVYRTPGGRFYATIKILGKRKSLGTYDTFEEAAKAREEGEKKHWGFVPERSKMPLKPGYPKPKPPKSSQYLGVSRDPKSNRWKAYNQVAGKTKALGYYATEEEAAKARDQNVRDTGQKKPLNFP